MQDSINWYIVKGIHLNDLWTITLLIWFHISQFNPPIFPHIFVCWIDAKSKVFFLQRVRTDSTHTSETFGAFGEMELARNDASKQLPIAEYGQQYSPAFRNYNYGYELHIFAVISDFCFTNIFSYCLSIYCALLRKNPAYLLEEESQCAYLLGIDKRTSVQEGVLFLEEGIVFSRFHCSPIMSYLYKHLSIVFTCST